MRAEIFLSLEYKPLDCLIFLSMCQQSTVDEVKNFTEREKLYGLGYGMVDLALLISCLITPNSSLWTFDKRLHQLASRFSIAYSPH